MSDFDERNNSSDFDETSENLQNEDDQPMTFGRAIKKGFSETADTFKALGKAPREIIGLNIVNVIEGMAYFGILTYLVLYMIENVGLTDTYASWVVTGFMALVTISQLLFGGVTDKLGGKKALGIALLVLGGTRLVLGVAEPLVGGASNGLWSLLFWVVVIALGLSALSYGLYQPSIYALTRQYSDKKTSAVSYALLYAGMNLGAFVIGLALPWIRRYSEGIDDLKSPGGQNNGISGSLIFLAAMVFVALICYYFLVYRSKNKPQEDLESQQSEMDPKTAVMKALAAFKDIIDETMGRKIEPSFAKKVRNYFKTHPLRDARFDFFIFILIPVQTLFAYQNILIPTYLTRCFKDYPTLSDNYETFSNLNPLIVFVAAPVIAALTARSNVYKMMIIGTTVMAAPTFLLVLGQTPLTFLTFVLIMSIGESMWQPRFLQHVAEIAPKDKVGAYVGIAQLLWFMTKLIVGVYVGYFMENFIPKEGTQNPEFMWLIFACVAMISPVALFLARKWCDIKNPDKGETIQSHDEEDDSEIRSYARENAKFDDNSDESLDVPHVSESVDPDIGLGDDLL